MDNSGGADRLACGALRRAAYQIARPFAGSAIFTRSVKTRHSACHQAKMGKPMMRLGLLKLVLALVSIAVGPAAAQEKAVVGLIPKASKPLALDGKLTGWDGAFVTPVHVGHPDF